MIEAMELTDCRLDLSNAPDPKLRAGIMRWMIADNEVTAGQSASRSSFAVLLRDPTDAVIGGVWGEVCWSWLTIGTLFVPEELRGQGIGRRLMLAAEEEGKQRGCVGSTTDTYSFQARGFYESLGYTMFGYLDGYPPGHGRCFLSKRLA